MSGKLILSIEPPPRRVWWRPSTLLDLGHVEILLWSPPADPERFSFHVAPATWRRILLSAFLLQRARVVRGTGLVTRPTRWRAWELSPIQYERADAFLRATADDCRQGTVRYGALRHNCFHLAYQCLIEAGLGDLRRSRQWVGVIPTRGSRSFTRDVTGEQATSVMSVELEAGRGSPGGFPGVLARQASQRR